MIKALTFLMFMMFAMTTDAVGVIIPEVIRVFDLTMTEAGALHYATMAAIAIAGLFVGHLADSWGRKQAIVLGLAIFAFSSLAIVSGNRFWFFLVLLTLSGLGIGIFKTGALALIGDISQSLEEHTVTMNTVEGFFAVGAIMGPAAVTYLLARGVSWTWLYLIAGLLCLGLIATAIVVRYPVRQKTEQETTGLKQTATFLKNPFVLGFSTAAFFYVAIECAIYVWMPTLLDRYQGNAVWVARYGLTLFFIFRAVGRFTGAWVLSRCSWITVLSLSSGAVFFCFLFGTIMGVEVAIYLLPLSGIFMSVIYPTINSKGISCCIKSDHGAVAGILLFFTCLGAVVGPLAMGRVADYFGDMQYGFVFATGLAAALFVLALINQIFDPTRALLVTREPISHSTTT